jgi:hypothetical protein
MLPGASAAVGADGGNWLASIGGGGLGGLLLTIVVGLIRNSMARKTA